MPAGSSPKREREFVKLKSEFKQEGRYAGREDEVAARIVNKQRAESGEARTSSTPAVKSKPTAHKTPAVKTKSTVQKAPTRSTTAGRAAKAAAR
jgi:hypothetical protein